MTIPKQPALALVFVCYAVPCLLAKGMADKLRGEPEWTGIVIGLIFIMYSFAEVRHKNRPTVTYVPDVLRKIVILRWVVSLLWWSGLLIATIGVAERGRVYFSGLALSVTGMLIAFLSARIAYASTKR